MTRLTFIKSSGHYLGFSCKGHSGYAESGEDVVCAAVSAATQICAAYLLQYYPEKTSFSSDEDSAEIVLKATCTFEECDRQLATLESFAKSIASDYPDYFEYDFTEV